MKFIKLNINCITTELSQEQKTKIEEAEKFGFEPPEFEPQIKNSLQPINIRPENIISIQPSTDNNNCVISLEKPITLYEKFEEEDVIFPAEHFSLIVNETEEEILKLIYSS